MYTVLQTSPKNPNLKKFSFPASDIDADLINVLKNDPAQTYAKFGDDGSVILNFEKMETGKFHFFPMIPTSASSLNSTTKSALLEIRESVKDQLTAAYSEKILSAEAISYLNETLQKFDDEDDLRLKNPTVISQGEFTYFKDENSFRNAGSKIIKELEKTEILRTDIAGDSTYIRLNNADDSELNDLSDKSKSFLAELSSMSSDFEQIEKPNLKTISKQEFFAYMDYENNPIFETEDGFVFADDLKDSSINAIDIANADITSIYNPDTEAYDVRLYNDYSDLNAYDRHTLEEANILQKDEIGECIVLNTLITSEKELIFYDVQDNDGANSEVCTYLRSCIRECLDNEIIAQSIIDSQDFDINKQHHAAPVEIVRDDIHLSDSEVLNNFSVMSATDTYVDIKINETDGILFGEKTRTIDDLHESEDLTVHDDNSATVRVEIDHYGSVLEPSEKPAFDKLSEEAKGLLENIHHEFSQEFQIAVDDYQKSVERELTSDVMSHHHFLSDTAIHKTGYLLLDVKGDVWKDFSETELRNNGLSVVDGKYAAKFKADEHGDLKLESTATTSLGRAFEEDQIKLSSAVVTSAIINKKLADIDSAEKAGERYAEKNGMSLVRDGQRYALIPDNQVVNDRQDGLRSVLATKMDTTNIIRFDNLNALKTAMKEAKAIDKAEHAVYERQRLDMHVVPEKAMQHAFKKFEQNADKSVNVRTVSGDHISLSRNKDFSVTASSRDGSNAGQRVVVENSAEHQDAKMASMIKHGIYISKDQDAFKIGHVNEEKPRYAERTMGMALRAATVLKEDIETEKAVQAQKAVEIQKSEPEKERMIAVG